MSNVFIVEKYVRDKEHRPKEFLTPNDAVLEERTLLLEYPECAFIVKEVDGAGNEVPNRDINPRFTLKQVETQVRTKLADIMGSTKAAIGELEKEDNGDPEKGRDLGRVMTILEGILGSAERANEVFK